ncbi:NACHT domain-containing protein [Fusarium keratoplasticum]|nr:NACHT domain-containing protein [Fusarium keratoplasticum]
MATLESQGAPEPADSDPTRESISTRASTCESAFVQGLYLLDSNQAGQIYATGLRKLQTRFNNWTGYLGVFASGNGSLDQRLKRYPQHRDLVVFALNMLKDNLLQITAELSDQDSDDSSEEETDRREIEIEGVRMSINELDRLAIHIRQSSTSSLDARVKAFASRKAAEISFFETKAVLAVNALYPDAHESLRQHLSKSMVHRHTKLLYWKSHDKKLPSDPASHPPILTKAMEPVQRRASATTVLETKAQFPKPPQFDDGDETAPCPLCRKVFQRHDFTNDVWWKSHMNEDLVPFVCVATSCLDSPNFTRRSEWRVHIEQDHSEFWQQNTAIPLHGENKTHRPSSQGASENSPICPLCCSSPLEEPERLRARKPQTSSESPKALQPGSKEASDGTSGKKTVRFDVPEQEESLADQGSPTTPPATPRLQMKPSKHMMMTNHIAGHLQFLALLTPRLSTKNLADGKDIDFASSQAPSGDSNSGERSTLGDEFQLEEGPNTQSIDIRESFSETNSVPVPEESIAPQDEDIPSTEPMDWALFSSLDPPHGGEEDRVIKHIRESLLKGAANRFAGTDLPAEASEAAENLVTLLRLGDDFTKLSDPVLFRKKLTRESLYQFFNTSLSSVDDGVYGTLANHCTEEVWGRPLDILRLIVAGLSDFNLPLSTETLESLFPFWDNQVLGVFLKSYSTYGYEIWGHYRGYATDLRVVKAQFEDSAGSLPRGVHSWIFDDARFRKFLADPQPQLLWIHGTTGRGKTMLLCGIIDELRETTDNAISHSFFPSTNSGFKSATALVRELIHHLVVQRPWLLEYVRESDELFKKTLSGALTSLEDFSDVLRIMLGHASMTDTVFIIDDVHERTTEVGTLLKLIIHKLQIPSKWILASHSGISIIPRLDFREMGDFEEIDLNQARGQITQAISAYANYRVESLAARKHYKDSLKRNIYDYLVSNAYANFFWVSMVCRNLEHTPLEHGLLAQLSHGLQL